MAWKAERTPERRRAAIDAGRVTTEEWAALGFKGRGGYLGRGAYGTEGRAPGYGGAGARRAK